MQKLQVLDEAFSNGGQNGVCGKDQPQQRQNHLLLPQGASQLLISRLQLPVDRAMSSTQQTQPQPAPLSVQDQQQQLQNAVQQVQALCDTISAPWLNSGPSEIDAVRLLSQLGAIEEFARIAKRTIRNANVQHPSSPSAKRLCREVRSRPHVCAASRSVMLKRWSRPENSRNAAAEASAID